MTQQHEHRSRYIIGIDLGTTTTSVSYIDTAKDRHVHQFMIPQLVGPGEVAAAPMLPSFCYFPAGHEFPDGSLDLPWGTDDTRITGTLARMVGARVPGRLVTSAKSWLAHAGVDRTAGILPWGGDLEERAVSPVEVSRAYLEHVAHAWDERFGAMRDAEGTPCTLAEQRVILTVPASFDETARELTVQAASDAGIRHLVLIEEPLAVFYDWLRCHEDSWKTELHEGDTVLVIDIGGGTTDFSLIRIETGFTLRRTAAGDHLLLGGDNIDMALARHVEQGWNMRLEPRAWSMLVQQCREAKERLLTDRNVSEVVVTLAGEGSAVVGGSRSATIERSVLEKVLHDGFYPFLTPDAPGPKKRAAIQEMGLPYVSDPAVTRHLLAFLRNAAATLSNGDSMVAPNYILFNGGTMIPEGIRQRIASIVGRWCGREESVPELVSRNLSLAVSTGASYYGLVRRGEGVRVKGGIARSYYLEVAGAEGPELVCVMPRDTEEGVVMEVTGHDFQLVANQPVRFPLFGSATRLGDEVGDLMPDRRDVTELPPLQTIVTFGKSGQKRELSVRLGAMLNEVGTLDMWCATPDGQHRFPLSFDLRTVVGEVPSHDRPELIVEEDCLERAIAHLHEAFECPNISPSLTRELEDITGLTRRDWGAGLLRRFADVLLEGAMLRKHSEQHEARWLNLCSFAVRPGYGAPGDEHRARECWKLWHEGCFYSKNAPAHANWWVFWRRMAGGLRMGQQEQIGGVLQKQLFFKGDPPRLGPKTRDVQVATEMWRCFGALELLSIKTKTQAFQAMVTCEERREEWHYWVMARLAARQLLYGPANVVIPPDMITPAVHRLCRQVDAKPTHTGMLALTSITRLTGIRGMDVSDPVRAVAMEVLLAHNAPEAWVQQLREVVAYGTDEQAELAGDSAPLGLTRCVSDEGGE